MSQVIEVEGQQKGYQTVILTSFADFDTPEMLHLATFSDSDVTLQSPAFFEDATPARIRLSKIEMDALCDAWMARTGFSQQQRIAFLLVAAEALLLNLKRMIQAARLAENSNNTAYTTDTAQYIESFVARMSAELTEQNDITPDERRAAQKTLSKINHPQTNETPALQTANEFPF